MQVLCRVFFFFFLNIIWSSIKDYYKWKHGRRILTSRTTVSPPAYIPGYTVSRNDYASSTHSAWLLRTICRCCILSRIVITQRSGIRFPKKKGKKIGQKYYNVIIIYLRTYTKWKTLYILLYRLIKRFRVVRAYYICVRYGLAVSMVSGCYYDFYTDFYYCNSSFFCEPQEVKFLKRNHQAGLWW